MQEGANGLPVEAGRAYIAPGDYHMRVVRAGIGVRLALDQGPPLNSCRPAADALFESAIEVYGGPVLGAILTGMGHDGLRGSERLKASGGYLVAQDEASSVVWGMPGAVVEAGLADQVVPLDRIAATLTRQAAG